MRPRPRKRTHSLLAVALTLCAASFIGFGFTSALSPAATLGADPAATAAIAPGAAAA